VRLIHRNDRLDDNYLKYISNRLLDVSNLDDLFRRGKRLKVALFRRGVCTKKFQSLAAARVGFDATIYLSNRFTDAPDL